MSDIRTEFFAMPDEQRRWLERLLYSDKIWCVVRQLPPTRELECATGTDFLQDLDFSERQGRGVFQLFIGNKLIVRSPVWQTTQRGRELDFIRSQAIQFDPSRIAFDNILLEGQFAIMRQQYYGEANIDTHALRSWFSDVTKSFSSLKCSGAILAQRTTVGTTKAWPKVILTQGAVEWRRMGRLLKQFPNGAVEFDIQDEKRREMESTPKSP